MIDDDETVVLADKPIVAIDSGVIDAVATITALVSFSDAAFEMVLVAAAGLRAPVGLPRSRRRPALRPAERRPSSAGHCAGARVTALMRGGVGVRLHGFDGVRLCFQRLR
jgi:hypothetical protein